MKIKFAGDAIGISAQRRCQVDRNHACETCRRRKKRCEHSDIGNTPAKRNRSMKRRRGDILSKGFLPHVPATSSGRSSSDGGHDVESLPKTRQNSIGDGEKANKDILEQSPYHSVPQSQAMLRFVGDLSPEAIFHESIDRRQAQKSQEQNRVGTWLMSTAKDPEILGQQTFPLAMEAFLPSVQVTLHPYIKDQCLSVLPPEPHLSTLVDTYFSSTHPMLPLLDEKEFRHSYAAGTASVQLLQAICIVSSRDFRAKEALHLPDIDLTSCPREFAQRIYAALSCALWLRLEKNKIRLIQLLSLMSLHSEGSDGWEESSIHLAQAVQFAQTIGLHIGRPQANRDSSQMTRLFCCLWSLDRLNAAMRGRPIIMQDKDIGRELRASISYQKSAFGVWMRISIVLNHVIELYRPDTDLSESGWEDEFPDFESIISECDASQMESQLLGERFYASWNSFSPAYHDLVTTELFYHAVSILSCRLRDSRFKSPYCKSSYIRQSLSALRITEMARSWHHHNLVSFPIFPYALCLAMSIAFRKFSQSTVLMHRTRAQDDLGTGCTALSNLAPYFWVAEAMFKLCHQTLHELSKVSDQLSNNGHRLGICKSEEMPKIDKLAKDHLSVGDDKLGMELQLANVSMGDSTILEEFQASMENKPDLSILTTPPSAVGYVESQCDMSADGPPYSMNMFGNFNYDYVNATLEEQLEFSWPINYGDFYPFVQ